MHKKYVSVYALTRACHLGSFKCQLTRVTTFRRRAKRCPRKKKCSLMFRTRNFSSVANIFAYSFSDICKNEYSEDCEYVYRRFVHGSILFAFHQSVRRRIFAISHNGLPTEFSLQKIEVQMPNILAYVVINIWQRILCKITSKDILSRGWRNILSKSGITRHLKSCPQILSHFE